MKNEIRKRKKEKKKEKEKKKKKEEKKKNLRAQEMLTSLGPVFVIGIRSISPSTPRAVARGGGSGEVAVSVVVVVVSLAGLGS